MYGNGSECAKLNADFSWLSDAGLGLRDPDNFGPELVGAEAVGLAF